MSYETWQRAAKKIGKQSIELKNLTSEYESFSRNAIHNQSDRKELRFAYNFWQQCGSYKAERRIIGAEAEQSLTDDAGIKIFMCAYDSKIPITEHYGAVTMLAYDDALLFAGHTHLAFEYMESANENRHVVYHLVALGGGCDQLVGGTGATVMQKIPITKSGETKYGHVGIDAFKKSPKKDADPKQFEVKNVDDITQYLPNNDSWTDKKKKYRSQSVSVPTGVAKYGHLLCRQMSQGGTVTGVESHKFHKLKLLNPGSTNCVQFAMSVVEAINVHPNNTMKLLAYISPPRAIQFGKLNYGATE